MQKDMKIDILKEIGVEKTETKKPDKGDYGITNLAADGLVNGVQQLTGQVNKYFKDGEKITYSRVWRAVQLGIVKGLGPMESIYTQSMVKTMVNHFQQNPLPVVKAKDDGALNDMRAKLQKAMAENAALTKSLREHQATTKKEIGKAFK